MSISPSMQKQKLTCPKCHEMSGVLQEEMHEQDIEVEHLPNGSQDVTIVQCENDVCMYEWNVRTRKQTLQSMRHWIGSGPRTL